MKDGMRVDLAFFKGDELLRRYEYRVRDRDPIDDWSLCNVNYRLVDSGAEFTFSRDENWRMLGGIYLREPFTLLIPAVESSDWHSVVVGKYTLAYWVRLGA